MSQPSAKVNPVNVSLSLAKARGVVWPFNKHFRQIGDLLDEGLITERDLAWAAFVASNMSTRIREASRTILAHKLGLPVESAGGGNSEPQVISGSKYLQTQERWSFGETFAILGFATGAGFMYSIVFIQEWLKGTITIPIVLFVIVALVLALRWVHKESRRAYREYEAFRQGREGEDSVTERALANLDGNWTIFRNFVTADRRGDIDIILVGPGGVWALEVKTYSANTRPELLKKQPTWSRRKKAQATTNIQGQTISNAIHLKTLLAQRGCPVQWVGAVLVFAEYQPVDFTNTSSDLDVWGNSDIDSHLVQVRSASRLSEQQIERIATEIIAMQR